MSIAIHIYFNRPYEMEQEKLVVQDMPSEFDPDDIFLSCNGRWFQWFDESSDLSPTDIEMNWDLKMCNLQKDWEEARFPCMKPGDHWVTELDGKPFMKTIVQDQGFTIEPVKKEGK